MRNRLAWVLAICAVGGVGAALGVFVALSLPIRTRTVTVDGASVRTVTRVRTIERVRVRATAVAGPDSGVASSGAAGGSPALSSGSLQTQHQFSGNGRRVLGRIAVPEPGATLVWTNSAGRFRLLFNGTGLAVDSTARGGRIAAPALTYTQVTVDSTGHWTLQLRLLDRTGP